jgi:hypothetical protein
MDIIQLLTQILCVNMKLALLFILSTLLRLRRLPLLLQGPLLFIRLRRIRLVLQAITLLRPVLLPLLLLPLERRIIILLLLLSPLPQCHFSILFLLGTALHGPELLRLKLICLIRPQVLLSRTQPVLLLLHPLQALILLQLLAISGTIMFLLVTLAFFLACHLL